MVALASCGESPKHAPDAASSEEAHGHPHGEEAGPEPLSFTVYTDQTELFVEFKPLIAGQTSSFAAHLTRLGPTFKPLTEGQLTVSLVKGTKGIRQAVTAPRSPGIFGPKLQPKTAGNGYQLIFDIKTKEYADRIVIDQVRVYPDEKTAIAGQAQPTANGDEISFLKEQAWKIDFANQPVQRQPF